ncbi:Crp/Fnr family transcriptional regulator [Kitasatospora sp. NPDC058397]|uniref:Crp/Fnr family transcriptional regulator n=1 Tax=unclassified Kitasatospora TaxID=2633591 RepID=UPI00364E1379
MNLCNNSSSGLLMGPNRTFQALVGPAAWNGVLKGTERRKLPAGRKLVRQGDVGAFVIVVISGVVRVDQIGGGAGAGKRLLAFRRGGDLIGDLAVLGFGVRTATVTAYTDCEVAIVPGETFRSPGFQRDYGLAISSYIAGRHWEAQMLAQPGDNRARVAWVLVPLLDHEEGRTRSVANDVQLSVVQRDLASCLGIGAKQVRQVVSVTPFGGTLAGRRGRLVVEDPEGLRAAAARLGGLP